jgi:hypothetical protein
MLLSHARVSPGLHPSPKPMVTTPTSQTHSRANSDRRLSSARTPGMIAGRLTAGNEGR